MTVNQDKPANKHKIIIGIDDDIDQLMLLQTQLNAEGYTFFGATSGAQGLLLLERAVPRLIILDVAMPDMDGFETCRRMRANRVLAQVPIVLLTARRTEADVRTATSVGANDFIVKPFDAERLANRVHYWVNRRVGTAA
jgi:DNA-binding response OmpR family regulator